jgi:hypothetical protein
MPHCAYVGSRPIPAVAADIARIVMISTRRRPIRSPMWLKKRPPSGRAK